ncbi:hypothetical protein [Psychromarinibacter halotolerans]|uniref:Uncharacterized protein n=1 Tax=Psychromarinibacter halotolerans TaxID=1775175 RepID=A0ABV7H361_9RHOB|nr:hypothetical protein [Psychromarinibacter halotolerans]MDF0596520.1 hypothetical protein [Psychromarinibacter halotolerans]
MNTSPITSWDGAEAIFTWADSPMMMGIALIGALAVTVGAIVYAASHDKHAYASYKPK